MAKPLVAIVGRPNVGKSTFFNKIAGRRISIVEDVPGVTRDRVYADVEWMGRRFSMVDTGGLDMRSEDVLLSQMRRQAEIAMDTADVICFFCDGRTGLTSEDEDVANYLRRTRKPLLLVVNKMDYQGMNDQLYEYYNLGLGDPIAISSTNMLGLGDLLEEIVKRLPPPTPDEAEEEGHVIQLALVGRPNVGKSSLCNRLLGQERTMVSDIPGTTRDVLSERMVLDGKVVRLSDTAGIRESEDAIERMGVARAQGEVEAADVALLVLDASQPLAAEDAALLSQADERYIVCLNKGDLPAVLTAADVEAFLGKRAGVSACCSDEDVRKVVQGAACAGADAFPASGEQSAGEAGRSCALAAGGRSVPVVSLCAATGEGVAELLLRLRERLDMAAGEEECFTVERQLHLAREAAELLRNCARALQEGFSPDVVAPDILKACALLDSVTGRDASEAVIDAIFANFCVGK